MTLVCILVFFILSMWQIKIVTTGTHYVKSPYCEQDTMMCNSGEMLMIVLLPRHILD